MICRGGFEWEGRGDFVSFCYPRAPSASRAVAQAFFVGLSVLRISKFGERFVPYV